MAVVVFSLIGSVLFYPTEVKTFPYKATDNPFTLVKLEELPIEGVFLAMWVIWSVSCNFSIDLISYHINLHSFRALGFSLSILFFMDQNISAAMVDSPDNKLKKGNAVSENAVFVKTMTSRKIPSCSISRFFLTSTVSLGSNGDRNHQRSTLYFRITFHACWYVPIFQLSFWELIVR